MAETYFRRLDADRFSATESTGGGWDASEQHIAPSMGLLAHLVEQDRDHRRDDGLAVARLSYDILGTVPVDVVQADVRVVRPGRTIELVEATLSHGERPFIVLRAWLMQSSDNQHLAGTPVPRLEPPGALPEWDPAAIWPGGFIGSVEVRREEQHPGRGRFWVRTDTALLDDEPTSDLARFAGLLDIANGMTVRVDPHDVTFPNLDLTVHFFERPVGQWVGFDTTVSFGTAGAGLTSSVIHDQRGPIGTLAQSLTVRTRG